MISVDGKESLANITVYKLKNKSTGSNSKLMDNVVFRLCFYLFLFGLCLPACSSTAEISDDPDLNTRFLMALYKGDLAVIDSCLAVGVDVNIRDVNDVPAVIVAANSGNVEAVKKLLEKGADVNARSTMYYNSTALMEIAANRDAAMAAFLIENGANVHLIDTFGDPAINWAAYYGDIPFVDVLVKNGASWEVESEQGTAIEVAMKQWNDPLLAYFIKAGAGQALSGPALELVKAVRGEDTEGVQTLLAANVSPDQLDELGSPILIYASSIGSLEIIKLLLEAGAKPDLMNRVGQTALSRAAYFGHVPVVELLLAYRADVNQTDDHYQLSSLISAAAGGNPTIGQLLIDRGADLDHQEGISGFTSLMMATAYNREAFIKLLLDAGANPYIKTIEGMTLSDMVGYSNNPKIAEMVQEYLMKH